tara:strand:- start:476 stop:1048 length:573 start_codon:yes stop_codon:yes gene_type:complete
MKVLFLDNDGVICLWENWGSRFKKQKKYENDLTTPKCPVEARFDNFDKKAIKVLNKILEKTGAEIVVSSDWRRKATLEEMGQYYLAQGIIKAPIGFTPEMKDLDFPPDFPFPRNYNLEQERSLEVLDWLENHPEVTHWVAVDDLDMADTAHGYPRGWGLSNFVWTPQDTEGIKQTGKAKKIIKFLEDDDG